MIQFHRKKPSIINDKQVQTALSLGYVKYAENQIHQFLPDLLQKSYKTRGKLMITKKLLSLLKKASMFETEDELETFKNDF